MKGKFVRLLASLLVVVGLLGVLSSCSGEETFTVQFAVDGGSEIASVEVKNDGLVTKPSDPIKDGYKFVGWFKDSDYTVEWDFSTDKIAADTTIYAKWDLYTIAELLALDVADYEMTEENYIVDATVSEILRPEYGAMNIEDETGVIYVFDSGDANGVGYAQMEDKPYQYDKVIIKGKVKNFKGTKELHEAVILSFEHVSPEFDDSEYEEVSIADARLVEEGTKVKVTGTIAQITYATGLIPNGFMLVDSKASIYVYDSQIAGRAKIGNVVTICATKDYYILDTEQGFADKYGYKGANQLANAHLISISDTVTEVNLDFAPTATVKEIMDVEVTEDFTTSIYKTNALVKRVADQDFVNYYFYDLDEKTGTYTYTQASGSDFAWLDKFDGKICTVYLTVLNAKSTTSGIIKRFLPIVVQDEGYQFDLSQTPQFIFDYYLDNQFGAQYAADPNLNVLTSFSSELLGINNAQITYTSSNPELVYFSNGVMHINPAKTGNVTITVEITLGSYAGTRTYDIEVVNLEDFNYQTVGAVLTNAYGTEVTIRGVVASAVINQKGFYLIDATGAVAVRVSQEVLDTLKIGDEVIIRGILKEKAKDANVGNQIVVDDASVVFNLYGNNKYSTNSFVNSTMEDLVNLPNNDQSTAKVFVVKAILNKPTSTWGTYELQAGDFKLQTYQGSSKQYEWLNPYAGQELTYEVAICNWNGKANKLCIISVTDAEGNKVINTGTINQ